MGWKTSTIIIKDAQIGDETQLLSELGFTGLKKAQEKVFDSAMYAQDGKVYIGGYKGHVVICEESLAIEVIEGDNTPFRRNVLARFPDAEICAVVLHSVVNLWGFTVIKSGKAIRTRAGSSEDGTFLELGDPIPEEKVLLDKARLDADGNRVYLFEEFPNEPFSEDAVGENFVFAVCERYFGEPLDSAEDLLFHTSLTGYSYQKRVLASKSHSGNSGQPEQKPWWMFWT